MIKVAPRAQTSCRKVYRVTLSHNQQQGSILHKNANFLGPTNEHPSFGLCLRPDNDTNEALGP